MKEYILKLISLLKNRSGYLPRIPKFIFSAEARLLVPKIQTALTIDSGSTTVSAEVIADVVKLIALIENKDVYIPKLLPFFKPNPELSAVLNNIKSNIPK
jgi:hypothetical protein